MAKIYNLEIDGKSIYDLIYPIGSIYETVDKDFIPSDIFGGIWNRIKGKMIVGVDEEDDEISESEKTGGEKMHTLTTNEIPPHKHNLPAFNNGDTNYGNGAFVIDTWRYQGQYYQNNAWYAREQSSTNTGGGASHNNMPPYYSAYIWVRIG